MQATRSGLNKNSMNDIFQILNQEKKNVAFSSDGNIVPFHGFTWIPFEFSCKVSTSKEKIAII